MQQCDEVSRAQRLECPCTDVCTTLMQSCVFKSDFRFSNNTHRVYQSTALIEERHMQIYRIMLSAAAQCGWLHHLCTMCTCWDALETSAEGGVPSTPLHDHTLLSTSELFLCGFGKVNHNSTHTHTHTRGFAYALNGRLSRLPCRVHEPIQHCVAGTRGRVCVQKRFQNGTIWPLTFAGAGVTLTVLASICLNPFGFPQYGNAGTVDAARAPVWVAACTAWRASAPDDMANAREKVTQNRTELPVLQNRTEKALALFRTEHNQ